MQNAEVRAAKGTCFGFGRDAEFVPRVGAIIIRDQFVSRSSWNPIRWRDAKHMIVTQWARLSRWLCETKLGAVVRDFKSHSDFGKKARRRKQLASHAAFPFFVLR